MSYEEKNSMFLSIIFVFLSRDTAVSSNQATQTNDNVEEKSSKQTVQKLSSASTDDAKKKSSEKMKIASTIKITNKNKEK
jgi:exopolysaccharide biosynthesis protein